MNRIQNDRDLLRSLRFTLKKHLLVVKFAEEKVVCTPSELCMVTAQAQFPFKGKEQSTGRESSTDSQGEWPWLGEEDRALSRSLRLSPHGSTEHRLSKPPEKGVWGCCLAADSSSVSWQPGGQINPGVKPSTDSLGKRQFCRCLQHRRGSPAATWDQR